MLQNIPEYSRTFKSPVYHFLGGMIHQGILQNCGETRGVDLPLAIPGKLGKKVLERDGSSCCCGFPCSPRFVVMENRYDALFRPFSELGCPCSGSTGPGCRGSTESTTTTASTWPSSGCRDNAFSTSLRFPPVPALTSGGSSELPASIPGDVIIPDLAAIVSIVT